MYSIKLTNYAFDDTYSNIRLFDDKVSRETFFDAAEGSTQIVDNFNAGDLLYTQIIFDAQDSEPLQKLLNYNYAIVKLLDENKSVSSNNETLYFHIKKSRQASQQRIICDVELDPFMTYWYDIEFSDCLITRAHLDRFIRNEDNTFKFDGRAISNLFEREDIKELSKRLVDRKQLKMIVDEAHDELQDAVSWIDENIIAWAYITCDANEYSFNDENIIIYPTAITKRESINTYIENYYSTATFVYPIFKKDKKIILQNEAFALDNFMDWNAASMDMFAKNNGGYSFIKNVKLSIKPPINFNNLVFSLKYTIDSNNNLVLYFNDTTATSENPKGATKIFLRSNFNSNTQYTFYRQGGTIGEATIYSINAIFNYSEDYQEPILFKTENELPQLSFFANEIIGKDRNLKFNPKLNNSDYKSMRICFAGNIYDIDIQKVNSSYLNFEYTEMITPDVTKGILRLTTQETDGIFNEYYAESFNGLLFTNDLSIPISNGQLDLFLANNKNAYLSFENQQQYNIDSMASNMAAGGISGIAQMVSHMAQGNIAAGLASGVSTVAGTVNNAIQLELKNNLNQAQFNLSIDNMRNAPQTLVNANGNAIFLAAATGLKFYVEIYSALESELKIANDYAFENGYYFNQYGNIKDYCCTRKYFNYIEAVPDNIIGKVSNEIKQRIKSIISRGVRFWHVDEISYSKENYELMLEEA